MATILAKILTSQNKTKINRQIRAKELRVIGQDGENLGVISLEEAIKNAQSAGLDLIEISPNSVPPIAKIADYGKFLYEQNKKQKQAKAKSHTTEVKTIQVKLGTDENDLAIKARKVSEWLSEGNRVKIDLFLPGRTKFMEENFLKDRINRILKLISVDYKIAIPIKKDPKGLSTIIEKK
ncbi:MAG TPA: translation initiation factor IF-3 [Candidatus Paceibacterota bacterium]|nr:translation initiation factor IF-3 [Candidatus Paceibacterota bacterium]